MPSGPPRLQIARRWQPDAARSRDRRRGRGRPVLTPATHMPRFGMELSRRLPMPLSLADLEREIQGLSVTERARLAAFILASLDAVEDADADEAWTWEIEARVTAYERGEATPIPADDVIAEAR